MRVIILLLLCAVLVGSCSTYKCYPSKRSRDYADFYRVKPYKGGVLVTRISGFKPGEVRRYGCSPGEACARIASGDLSF
jgi:hypothetical protein